MSQEHDESFNSIESEDIDDKRDDHNASGSGSSSGSDSDTDSSSSSSESSDGGERDRHSSPERGADDNACDADVHAPATTTKTTTTKKTTSTAATTSSSNAERRTTTNAGTSAAASSSSSIGSRAVEGGGVAKTAAAAGRGAATSKRNETGRGEQSAGKNSGSKTEPEVTKTNGYTTDDDTESESDSDSDSHSDSHDDSDGDGVRNAKAYGDVANGSSRTNTTLNTSSTTATTTDNNTSNTTTANDDDEDGEEDVGDRVPPKGTAHSDGSEDSSANDNDSSDNDDDDDDDEDDGDESPKKKKSAIETIAKRSSSIGGGHGHDDDDDDADEEEEGHADGVGGSETGESTKSTQSSAADSPTSASSSSSSSDDDDGDDYQPKRTTRQVRKPAATAEKGHRPAKKRKRKNQNWDSDESGESDGDDSEDSAPSRRKPPAKTSHSRQQQQQQLQKRHKKSSYSSEESGEDSKRFGTRRSAAAISYKEASEDEKTGSDDLLEVEYDDIHTEAAAAAAAEEEEKCETIERILAKRRGRRGCTGNQTTIYAAEEQLASGATGGDAANESGDATAAAAVAGAAAAAAAAVLNDDEAVVDENDPDGEVQYRIKWKGWSYIHNTWESEATLRDQKVKGMKKLDNFIKKEQDIALWRRYAGPEDIDYFECQLELQNDLLKSYNSVDRIIARNAKADGASEYLCKWQSLPYAEATWEDEQLVRRKWRRCVEQFEERESSKCTPSRHCKVLRSRPKFYKIKVQPEFLGEILILRDYQMDGLNWLLHSWCKENSVILADEMGLGKTIQTICFLYTMFKVHQLYGPYLCVVPLSTMTAWQREFDLWAPEMNVVTYLGDVKSREMIRQYEWQFDGSKRLKFNCILTTYEIVLKDKLFLGTLQWAALLVDEAHRLKNDDSLLYKSLKEFETNHRLLITGTPLQNSLKELWALLHFIMPEKFVTWEDFEVEHGNAADKGYTRLHQQLEPYILRRVKKDVEKSLPAKVEQILRVEMTSLQKQYYKWILTKNFEALRKGKRGSTSTFLNIVIELKKCCNHAALIRPSEFELMGLQQDEALQTLLKGSGKLVLLDKLLCRLKETGHRVLIFSQMVRMLDILADYLQKRHFSFQRLDGSIKGEMRRQALDHFNADGSQDFCFLLSTRAGGLGINLATADTVIIFDSDWNPQNDLQAQARAHRIGQKNQVNIYRLVTARSVEEQIVERAKQKMVLDHLVIQRMDTTGRTVLDKSGGGAPSNTTPFNKDDLSAILKFGAEELFKDEQENDEELVCDIDDILRRAETRNDDPDMPGDDLLSAFKVASIAAFEEDPGDAALAGRDDEAGGGDEDDTKDWDDIIPENFRKKVEDQERAKEMEDLYLPPRRKTTQANQAESPPKRGAGVKKGGGGGDDDSCGDSDYDAGSDGSGDDGRPKKRGRPAMKEKIEGFTDAEIRRFIKSYKKFPAPLMRLEAIACDAELQEKPLAELKRIGELLHQRCVQFFEEHKEEAAAAAATAKNAAAAAAAATGEDTTSTTTTTAATATKQKRSRATFSVKLGGVSFNAKTLLSCEEELKPLNEIVPSVAAERLNWALNIKTRPANFDVDWGVPEDSRLLCGIYQYGIGSWEQMKMDPSLRLTEKMLLNDARKPQAKHLQSRSEYLLKIIKKNVELKRGVQRKQRKPRKTKAGAAAAAAASSSSLAALAASGGEGKTRHTSESRRGDDDVSQSGDALRAKGASGAAGDVAGDGGSGAAGGGDGGDASTSSSPKKKKTKRSAGGGGKTKRSGGAADASNNKPMHFTANNEPRALEVLGDLDPNIFNECKEKMRPVKKALKALDRPDSSLSNQEQVKHTRDCLLSIGKQIDICLETYKETEKKEWRSNLWYFVSKFTEFDARKLFKLYKHTLKTATVEAAAKAASATKDRTTVAGAATATAGAAAASTTTTGGAGASSKDEKKVSAENGAAGGKDKNKKKKKDKDRDKDKEKEKDKEKDKAKEKEKDKEKGRNSRFDALADKSLARLGDSPNKRKRDENDLNDGKSGGGSGAYKRMNMDGGARNRDRAEERKKHREDYYAAMGGDRRSMSLNTASSTPNNRGMHAANAARLPPGAGGTPVGAGSSYMGGVDGRQSSPFVDGGGSGDRWGGHGRDRYGASSSSSDYKRDRYDSYNRAGGGGGAGYHRDRDRDRRPEKRRYPPSHQLPPGYSGHYMPPNFYVGNGLPPSALPPSAHAGGAPGGGYRGSPGAYAGPPSSARYPPDYRRSGGGGGDYGDRRSQT